jgi:hypothetical protein
MKNIIRKWLGLDKIQEDQHMIARCLARISTTQTLHLDQLKILYSGVARIIAKIDPEYSRSEFDPIRKAESDKLGAEVMNKLIGEHLAQRHSTGEE